ncbi:hypothetical protein ACXR0O_02590 [Verrucomicrobiota bacterium sgz303538]
MAVDRRFGAVSKDLPEMIVSPRPVLPLYALCLVWVADTSGAVRLLLRDRDVLFGKTVMRFVALQVVLGAGAQL